MTSSFTYDGPFRAASVVLPDRTLTVVRGQSYEITDDEVEHLDTDAWKANKPAKKPTGHKATDTDTEA